MFVVQSSLQAKKKRYLPLFISLIIFLFFFFQHKEKNK